ncbi:MAG: hypothetical protein KDJ29_16035 [Hyphomicrobiales bacterium]|nr:hypothetical protein [Hyphomicrobiales bacterium]
MALAILPLVAASGLALEYSRLVNIRTKLQTAIDSAILASVKLSPDQLTDTAAQDLVNLALAQLQSDRLLGTSALEASFDQIAADKRCMQGKFNTPLGFSALTGYLSVDITASACATASKKLEVALVLDNTGSMAKSDGGVSKMDALKEAAKSLVTTLNPSTGYAGAAISVVPFAAAVNVGAHNKNASWMDTSGQSSIHWQNYTNPQNGWRPLSKFDVFAAMKADWAGCVEELPGPYMTKDTAPSVANPDTLFVPFLAPDDAGSATGVAAYWVKPSDAYPAEKWGGYYWSFNSYLGDSGGSCRYNDADSREDNADPVSRGSGATKLCKYNGATPAPVSSGISGVDGTTARFSAGPNLSCTASPLQPLTTDMSRISGPSGAIENMRPNGDTNLVSGLMWGWRTISPKGPFANVGTNEGIGPQKPATYDGQSTKVIVLMTDGFNHWADNPYSSYGSIYSAFGYMSNNRLAAFSTANKDDTTNVNNYRDQMDAAFLDACSNAKKAGVKIFTVAFSTASDPIDEKGMRLLKECATTGASAYQAADKSALNAAFVDIAKRISLLRLSK